MKTAVFAAVFAAQATTCVGGGSSAPAPVETPYPSENIGLAHCAAGSQHPVTTGDITLDSLSDTLTVDVTYRGGCMAHEMTLCWSGWSTVAQPTRLLGFHVDHWNNGDTCTTLVKERLQFDLSELRYQYSVEGGGFGEDERVTLEFEDGRSFEYVFVP